jgi:hypothetical protein
LVRPLMAMMGSGMRDDTRFPIFASPPRSARAGHAACPLGDMKVMIALAALALLAVLLGSAWTRRGEYEFTGESRAVAVGIGLCFAAVVMILLALSAL